MTIQQVPPGTDRASTLIVGATPTYATQTIGGKTSDVLVLDTAANASITIGRFSANVNPIDFQGLKSRAAAIGGHTAVVTGDNVLALSAHADDGTTYNTEVGNITFACTGTIATGQVPGRLTVRLANATGTLKTALTSVAPAFTATNATFQLTDASTAYLQAILQNTSNGAAASTDYIVAADNATDSANYGDFGINSSAYTGSGSLNLAGATYLYANGGELVLGTTSANGIRFFTNGSTTDYLGISSAGFVSVGTTGTATASGGAATCNHQRGTITSEALITAAGARYTLTLTNSRVTTSSIVLASVALGSNTTDTMIVSRITPASGSVVIQVKNDASLTAWNGTIKIAFVVL